MTQTAPQPTILRDLGDGLVLRRSVPADADALAEFNSRIHGDETVGVWTRDLLLKPHPTFHSDDFTIVEDTNTGKIVSSLNLISQTWTYAGIPFGVGRPELVGTDEAYRYRGLVRQQMEVVHEWSRQRGELVQAITGIPYYYRQFGYEMTLTLGGQRAGAEGTLPKLKEGEQEPYLFRAAQESDLPLIREMYARSSERALVSVDLDDTCWRYEMNGKSPDNCNGRRVLIVASAAGEPVGVVMTPVILWDNRYFTALFFEIKDGTPWQAPTASLLRYLQAEGLKIASEKSKQLTHVALNLGNEHPAYQVCEGWLPVQRPSYAYYMRVPDLPTFLMRIAPALEQNLSRSVMAGYSGELKISFYRTGIIMKFESGKLCEVTSWKPGVNEDVSASFPDLTFLHLVFGYRTLDDLRHIFADCWTSDEARPLLYALFPKKESHVQVLS
jgi:hypothetical protein